MTSTTETRATVAFTTLQHAAMQCTRFLAAIVLCFLPMSASAHEISIEDKPCICYGDLYQDLDQARVVNQHDVQALLDCFNGECSIPCDGADCPDVELKECSEKYGCPADLNHNHEVSHGDLMVLLGNWGDCPDPGDVNRDKAVDIDDVVMVEAALGRICTQDLDYQGRVGGNDLAIAEAAWDSYGDHHPGTDLDGDGLLSIGELISVFNSQGRDCKADVNYSGEVDREDLCYVCRLTTEDCREYNCPSP